jgi:hypothetical protein
VDAEVLTGDGNIGSITFDQVTRAVEQLRVAR